MALPKSGAEKTGATTVAVACKLGVAWFDLQLCEERQVQENTQTGPRMIKQFVKTGRIVRIRGTAYPRGEAPEGFPAKPEMVLGYAITRNVPKDFWDKWAEQHSKAPYVLSHMIMAFTSIDDVKAAADDHKGEISGLEPVQRDKSGITDPRLPRSTNKSVSDLAPADRAAA